MFDVGVKQDAENELADDPRESEIAEKLGRCVVWVQQWIRRAREGQTLNDLPRSGRPREIKDSTRSQIMSGLEEKSFGEQGESYNK